MFEDSLRLYLCDDRRECRDVSLLHRLQAAEMFEEPSRGRFAHSGDFAEFGRAITDLAPLAMERHSESMGFIADQLNQVEHRGMMVEHDGIVFLPVNVNDFFALGDGSERL